MGKKKGKGMTYCKAIKKQVNKEYRCPDWDCETCPEPGETRKRNNQTKKLEDVIPKDILNFHLSVYHTLKQVENPLPDFHNLTIKLSKIDDMIQSFLYECMKEGITEAKKAYDMVYKFMTYLEDEVLFEKYDFNTYLLMKRALETSRSKFDSKTGEKIVKRRVKGNKPASLARSYLLASLCGEIKGITGKPCYKVVADYFKNTLKEIGFNSKRIEVESKRIRKSHILLHITDILSNYNKIPDLPDPSKIPA